MITSMILILAMCQRSGWIDTGSIDPAAIRAWCRTDDFAFDMYKIGPGNFRHWDNPLRQLVLLQNTNAVIGVAPFDGFTHLINVFDTLGIDETESIWLMPD